MGLTAHPEGMQALSRRSSAANTAGNVPWCLVDNGGAVSWLQAVHKRGPVGKKLALRMHALW